MAETFNPIISHLYSGQGGVSREITKYGNTTISEINFNESGVTTKYDFGGLFTEKMFTGDRVWNQLIQNGNFASDSGWGTNNSSLSVSNNIGTLTASAQNGLMHRATAQVQGHKYLLMATIKLTTGTTDVRFSRGGSVLGGATQNTTDLQLVTYFYEGASTGNSYIGIIDRRSSGWDAIQVKNFMLFDLTLIYGSGNEPTTVAEFVHDYPELYYPYDAGTNFSLATKLFNTIKQPLDSIKFYGNTMRWCQLIQNGNFESTDNWGTENSNFSVSDNVGTFTATAISGAIKQNRAVKTGHKYLIVAQIKLTTATTSVYLEFRHDGGLSSIATQGTTNWQIVSGIISATGSDYDGYVRIRDVRSSDWDAIQVTDVQLFDLTYIFGAGNEPATVSDFTRRLKKLYYPFTNGEILSIEKASEYLYGINIWDEEWELGEINSSGEVVSGNRIVPKNFIRVLPSTAYYYEQTNVNNLNDIKPYYYDANYNFISVGFWTYTNRVQTTPANCAFIKFHTGTSYGTTYNNDICINLSDSSINGTYEASKGEQKMQLDSFNVWDEEWEVGGINGDTGANTGETDRIRSKNFIEVLPNTEYNFTFPSPYARIYQYDANKQFIGLLKNMSESPSQATTALNASFIRFATKGLSVVTYNNDICINLSDPSRNGIYVSYRGYVELNGVNDAVDTVIVEKNVTLPFGLVDLGTLDYNLITATETRDAFYATVDNFRGVSSSSEVPNIIAKNFIPVSYSSTWIPWTISVFGDNYSNLAICVPHNMFTGETLKAYLKAFYLYYELADYPLNGTPILAGSYVRKIEKVDMGTLTYTLPNTKGVSYTKSLQGIAKVGAKVICDGYETANDGGTDMQNGFCAFNHAQDIIYISDASFIGKTAEEVKALLNGVMLYYELATPVETTLTAQECAEILNGAFTKSKYSTLLTDNDNGQIDQTVDVGMWEQR